MLQPRRHGPTSSALLAANFDGQQALVHCSCMRGMDSTGRCRPDINSIMIVTINPAPKGPVGPEIQARWPPVGVEASTQLGLSAMACCGTAS